MRIKLHAEFSNLILEQHKPTAHQRSAARKGATRNTTTAPTRHPLPDRRQKTTHVLYDTPTHRPSHAPTIQPTHHATAVQKQTDALFRARELARAGRLYSGEDKIMLLYQKQ